MPFYLKNETVLEDSYPMHQGYAYIWNLVPQTHWGHDCTVGQAKIALKVSEIRRCDITERQRICENYGKKPMSSLEWRVAKQLLDEKTAKAMAESTRRQEAVSGLWLGHICSM